MNVIIIRSDLKHEKKAFICYSAKISMFTLTLCIWVSSDLSQWYNTADETKLLGKQNHSIQVVYYDVEDTKLESLYTDIQLITYSFIVNLYDTYNHI